MRYLGFADAFAAGAARFAAGGGASSRNSETTASTTAIGSSTAMILRGNGACAHHTAIGDGVVGAATPATPGGGWLAPTGSWCVGGSTIGPGVGIAYGPVPKERAVPSTGIGAYSVASSGPAGSIGLNSWVGGALGGRDVATAASMPGGGHGGGFASNIGAAAGATC